MMVDINGSVGALIQLISYSGGFYGERWHEMGGRTSSASVEG